MVGKSDLILLMGAMVIFSLITISANGFFLRNNIIQVNSELNFTAVSLAQNVINKARDKAFDQTTINGNKPSNVPSGFSSVLGPENGETYANFNDFDDFNNYSSIDTTANGVYTLKVTVHYVSSSNFKQNVTGPTSYKRMIVQVYNPSMKDTVRISYIKSFY